MIYFVGKPYPKAAELRKIQRLGYRLGLLLDKNATTKNGLYFDDIIPLDFSMLSNLARQIPHDLPASGLICTYENYIAAKAVIAEYLKLPSTSLASALASTDKFLMRQAFSRISPSISPKYALVNSLQEARGAGKKLGYPLILKPTNLVKSLLVLKCQDEASLLQNFVYAKGRIADLYAKYGVYGREPQIIVEEFMPGKLCSVAAFVDHRGKVNFCAGIATLTTAQEIGVDDNYLYARALPAKLSENLTQKIFAAAEKGIKALGMKSTPAHVELIYNKGSVKIIEIGARIGGYRPLMYRQSYGLDLLKAEINLAMGTRPDLAGEFNTYSGVFELFPAEKGAFASLSGVGVAGLLDRISLKAKPGQAVGPAKDGYKATAVVFASNPDIKTFESLCEEVKKLGVKLK